MTEESGKGCSVSREDLLSTASDPDNAAFLNIIKQHSSSADPFDLADLVVTFDRKQLDELWTSLMQKSQSLLCFENDQEEFEETMEVTKGIVTAGIVTIQQGNSEAPQSLFDTLVLYHGVLPVLPEAASKVKSDIAKVCEMWWTKDLLNKEELACNTMMYLLTKSLQPKVTGADVKRVWGMRTCLQDVNLSNESGDQMKCLLQQALMSSAFLKHEEGRRFLAYLFSLDVHFVEQLHKAIKQQIPYCAKSMLEWYGEVYFRAWRVATGDFLSKIEEYCLQDLMYHAVHAQRGSTRSLAWALRRVLGYIHNQKKQRGVDEMLYRLYAPILWRNLKVANAVVRANAAALLVDVFPLQDPESNMEDNDTLMQKHFDTLETLLSDPCPIVRVTTVQGVTRICNVFWEVIPAATISSFLNKLAHDLAWDGSSSEVRVAVLKGLTHILDNHLSHPVLKMLLPDLCNLLHDNAEKVRVTFVDLLLKVKCMRAIKFWAIVPMEHLLARLEMDAPPVGRRIVNLIFNSYMPPDKPPEVQLSRCVALVETNTGAARVFYRHATKHLSVVNTGKFMIMLCRYILECVNKEIAQSGSTEDDEEKENVGDVDGEVSAEDTDLMAGLLESIAVLWEGISQSIKKPGNTDIKEKLHKWFGRALPVFFKYFKDPRIIGCLTFLAGYLPANTIPTFSRTTLSKLKRLTLGSSCAEEYEALLESMCKWGRVDDVLELISDWLEATYASADPNSKSGRHRGVAFQDPADPQPMLGLQYLSYMAANAVCQQALLTTGKDSLRQLNTSLKKTTKFVEKRFTEDDMLSDVMTDDFLMKAIQTYCRIEILLHDPDTKTDNAVTVMIELLEWADRELIPMLKHKKQQKRRLLNQTQSMTLVSTPNSDTTAQGTTTYMSCTLLAPKRTASETQIPILTDISINITQSLLNVASNMLLVGVGDPELVSRLADFATSLLKTDEVTNSKFLTLIAELMYQMTEFTLSLDTQPAEQDEGVGYATVADIVPDMLQKVAQMIATLVQTKKEQAARILPTLKPALSEVLQSYFRHSSVQSSDRQKDVMSTIMAAVLAEMIRAIKEDNHFEKCEQFSDLPLLSSFLLSILNRRKQMARMFLEELTQCHEARVMDSLEGKLATLHLIYTLSKKKGYERELKVCVTTVQTQVEAIEISEDISEDSPYRAMFKNSSDLMKQCMAQIGMVA